MNLLKPLRSNSAPLLFVFLFCSLALPSKGQAIPPWKAAYRAEVKLQRALLEAQQAQNPLPKSVYLQQKKALKQDEKFIRRYYQETMAPATLAVPVPSARATYRNPQGLPPARPVTYCCPPTNGVVRSPVYQPLMTQTIVSHSRLSQPRTIQPNGALSTRSVSGSSVEPRSIGNPVITGEVARSAVALSEANSQPPRAETMTGPPNDGEPTLAPIPESRVSPAHNIEPLIPAESPPVELLPEQPELIPIPQP